MPDHTAQLSDVPLPTPKRLCKGCGEALPEGSPRNKQYHHRCLRARAREMARSSYSAAGDAHGVTLPPGTVGAAGELTICADLLRRGFHVFRSVSPSAPCDMIAVKPDLTVIRVESRTGQQRGDGTIIWPKKASDSCDVYAVVVYRGPDAQIHYFPDLP